VSEESASCQVFWQGTSPRNVQTRSPKTVRGSGGVTYMHTVRLLNGLKIYRLVPVVSQHDCMDELAW
jgi:hypothetical protein